MLETEVKFHLTDIEPMREAIITLGAIPEGRVFETNIRFEDEIGSLMRNHSLLRLRQDTKARLTVKSPPPVQDTQVKVRQELEVEVSDFSTMKQILESLGFHEHQIYEKWRETFKLNETEFCLDTMPYGNFLEIEGPKADIISLADKLGLKWEKRILMNYLAMFGIIRKRMNLPFSDLTFDNFKDIEIEVGSERWFHVV